MRKLAVFIADSHAGHRLGLMNPAVVLEDYAPDGDVVPYTPAPTAIQRWLWETYLQDVKNVLDLAAGCPVLVFWNGDITHGKKHPDQLVTTCAGNQVTIAVANIEPWMEYPNVTTLRFSHGTGSHSMGEGTTTTLVAEQVKLRYPGADVKVVRHGLARIHGDVPGQAVIVDYAHHGPTAGIRQWTNGNQLRYYTKSLLNDCLLRRKQPPDLVVRSHFHTYCQERVRIYGDREYVADAVVTPSYCGLSEYAQQASRSGYLTGCGVIAAECEDGLLTLHSFCRIEDLRTAEDL